MVNFPSRFATVYGKVGSLDPASTKMLNSGGVFHGQGMDTLLLIHLILVQNDPRLGQIIDFNKSHIAVTSVIELNHTEGMDGRPDSFGSEQASLVLEGAVHLIPARCIVCSGRKSTVADKDILRMTNLSEKEYQENCNLALKKFAEWHVDPTIQHLVGPGRLE